MKTLTERIGEAHREKFGDVEISWITTKLGEECGELQGAILKRVLHNKGGDAAAEIEDVLTVLAVLADRHGWDLSLLFVNACEKFEERAWPITNRS